MQGTDKSKVAKRAGFDGMTIALKAEKCIVYDRKNDGREKIWLHRF